MWEHMANGISVFWDLVRSFKKNGCVLGSCDLTIFTTIVER
jgi:hypothetical protein